ncbi:transposase [Allochromatium vinosum]|uniref:transposase n=1 Tax=Allochromatium vinosum TaxID=1049 RepID=UPI0019062F97
MLSDEQWSRIANFLPGKPTDKGGRAVDNRRFVEAVLYMARTGCPWRDLPKELGNWHSVYVRFEPPRKSRRLFGLSHAVRADSSSCR